MARTATAARPSTPEPGPPGDGETLRGGTPQRAPTERPHHAELSAEGIVSAAARLAIAGSRSWHGDRLATVETRHRPYRGAPFDVLIACRSGDGTGARSPALTAIPVRDLERLIPTDGITLIAGPTAAHQVHAPGWSGSSIEGRLLRRAARERA